MLPPKFQFVWLSSFKGEDSLEIDQSETRIACGAMFAKTKKKKCVSDCMVFKIRVGRSGFFFFFFKPTSTMYAPSSKITQSCFFLSYYSLLIIWHAVQCFWFQTSIKCTRKWRKLLKSETNTETETNFQILPIYFCFGIKNVRVGGKILGSVDRSETHLFFFLA